jgi:FemAB-related protein (PEP-CTERM system-associated)
MNVSRFEGSAGDWDEFVRAQPGWSHFHLYGWRAVIERVFRHECIYLVARDDDGKIAGVLPLVRLRSLNFGHLLVSMPFVNYGGPLGSDAGVAALLDESAALAAHDRVRLLELRSRRPLDTTLPASHRKITVVLDLPDTPGELWRRLPAKVRSQIRRPQKDGVEIRAGVGQLAAFYDVLAPHMRDLGASAQSFEFYRALAAEFPDDLRVTCAYLEGQPIAAGCGLFWRTEFEITWASALRSHKHLSANMLVYWSMMERAIADGARIFNFGRCTSGSGTHRFKRQWPGTRDEPLWWYQRTETQNTSATPSNEDPSLALAARLWTRVPLRIATRLGPSIVKYVP